MWGEYSGHISDGTEKQSNGSVIPVPLPQV